MTRIINQIFFIILDIALITIISLLFYLIQPVETTKIMQVQQGSITRIITQLSKENENISPKIDKYILRFLGNPQSGWIDMKKNTLTKADYLYNLSHAKAALQDITLIPGETNYIFLEELSKKLNLSIELLQKYYEEYAPYEDGWLVPETYHLPLGINEKGLITYLIEISKEMHKKRSTALLGDYNEKEWLRYLIIGSIIQKEAANSAEMPLVSSVIYNRLYKNMKLQMDGTLNYGKYSHIRVTPKRIREDTSRYNTYIYNGIPPNPVCAVSQDALKAAINPPKTTFLYFVKIGEGKHIFTNTYEEHLKNIKTK